MEKIKFGTEVFDLVPVGAAFGEEKARVAFVLPDGKTYEEIEAAVSGVERIEILDAADDILVAHAGYIYLDSLTKQKDYVIGTEQVESGTNEDGTIIYVNHDVTATVMIVTLKKSDIRQEVDAMNAKIDYMAMMTGTDLEV